MPSSSRIRFNCVPPAAIMMFGAPGGSGCWPSTSALFKKFTPSIINPCSVASSPFSIFTRSTTKACFCTTRSPVLVAT